MHCFRDVKLHTFMQHTAHVKCYFGSKTLARLWTTFRSVQTNDGTSSWWLPIKEAFTCEASFYDEHQAHLKKMSHKNFKRCLRKDAVSIPWRINVKRWCYMEEVTPVQTAAKSSKKPLPFFKKRGWNIDPLSYLANAFHGLWIAAVTI